MCILLLFHKRILFSCSLYWKDTLCNTPLLITITKILLSCPCSTKKFDAGQQHFYFLVEVVTDKFKLEYVQLISIVIVKRFVA